MNTKAKGNVAELKIASRFAELGYQVFFPFGENYGYDLVFESLAGPLKKVQIKSVQKRDGCIEIPLTSVYKVNGVAKKRRYTNIDFIGCYTDGQCYLIPFEDVARAKTTVRLRIDPPKGRGKTASRWAKDYEF